MSNSASSSPVDGFPKGNSLSQALQQSRSNQGSPVTGPGTTFSKFNDSPRSLYGSTSSQSAAGSVSRDSPTATPRTNQTYPNQSRNQTYPLVTTSKTDSPPSSAASLAMEKRRVTVQQQQQQQRPDGPHMLRTSSMDSTVSSMSSATTLSQSSAQADGGASSAEIASMIASAGSAENLIRQLLKEKRNAAAQNNQLFKLLNKQKSMMQGMHADLEKALADKERYRTIAQSLHVPVTPEAPSQMRKPSPAISTSSIPSSSSRDRLAFQRTPEVGSKQSQEFARSGLSQGAFVGMSVQSESVKQPASATSSKASNSPTVSEGGDPKRNTVVQASPPPLLIGKTRKDSGTASAATAGPISPKTPPRTPKSPDIQADSSRTSFTARRSMTQRKESFQASSNPGSPTDSSAASPTARKAPPAPLVLQKAPETAPPPPPSQPSKKTQEEYGPDDHTDSDYDELDTDELPTFERGRKKTREEDDLEREVMMIRAQRASESAKNEKSRSKSSKKSQKSPPIDTLPQSPSFKGISPPESPNSFQKVQAGSLVGMLSNTPSLSSKTSLVQERVVSPPLKSPGLPLSPRPQDRPANAAMPRNSNSNSTVASPPDSPPLVKPTTTSQSIPSSAPTGPLPQPPMSAPLQTKTSQVQHNVSMPQSAALQPPSRAAPEHPPLDAIAMTEPQAGAIFRGLMSDSYPDLLLPPNALPSILVKVTSSRLRPSRQSSYGNTRTSTDESVFTLGVFARSSQKQLWRIEKAAVSLISLEHQLKQVQPVDVKVPDKNLFSGHAPARVDARRSALENFFETLLDTHMNEKGAIILCRYFSSQVIPAEESSQHQHGKESDGSIRDNPIAETVVKEGYLTKKGKNFGGWKARYFVLNEPVLRYYESPTGSLLGTIRLTNAQIGRQTSHKRSPSRGHGNNDDDADSQYRHAFLIMEPKRNNSNHQLQHVLCAESDVERDEWVEALRFYLGKEPEPKSEGQKSKQTPTRPETARENKSIFQNMIKEKKERQSDASENPPEDGLRGFSYNDTAAGQAPVIGAGKYNSSARNVQTPPPSSSQASQASTLVAAAQGSPGHGSRIISGPRDAAPIGDASTWGNRDPTNTGISGPTNGAVITDASAWGNKDIISAPRNAAPIQNASQWGNKQPERRGTNELKPPESPRVNSKEKEGRKHSFWGGFTGRGHSTHGSTASAGGESTAAATGSAAASKGAARPVFGIPLAEAVEFCMAPGSTTPLPAVAHRCLEYLEARGAEMEEGIFRISGSTLTINKLKDRFNTEGDVNLLNDGAYYDVHAVASLLKLYLRELPERVLTNALYPKFVAVQELGSDEAKAKALNELVHKLPLPNWTLIQSLCRFLIQVDAASELSKMTVRNLCIVFAPTLNLSNPIITHFLRDFNDIFDKEPESAARSGDAAVGIEVTAPSPSTPNHLKLQHEPTGGGLGLQYEDVLQLAYGLNSSGGGTSAAGGDDSSSQTSGSTRLTGTSSGGGGLSTTRTGPGLSAAAGGPKDMKQKRRESSMLMMNNFPAPGNGGGGSGSSASNQGLANHSNPSAPWTKPQRKSSLPLMREPFS